MKHHLLLFIMVFLFPFMACGDDELKEIYNPNLLRSTSIDDSSLHLAFPAIAGNKDRSKIIVVYREGSSHVSFDSKYRWRVSIKEKHGLTGRLYLLQLKGMT